MVKYFFSEKFSLAVRLLGGLRNDSICVLAIRTEVTVVNVDFVTWFVRVLCVDLEVNPEFVWSSLRW